MLDSIRFARLQILLPSAFFVCLAFAGLSTAQDVSDLSLAIAVEGDSFAAGDSVHFVVTVTNAGPDPATGVEVEGKWKEIEGVQADVSKGALEIDKDKFEWIGLVLDDGESVTMTVSGRIEKTPAKFEAEVEESDSEDPDSEPGKKDGEDDSAAYTFAEEGADLALSAYVTPSTVQEGETVTFTVTLWNDGPNTAVDVKVEAKTKKIEMTDASSVIGEIDVDDHKAKWGNFSVGPGESYTFTITAAIEELPSVFEVEVKKSETLDPDSRPGKGTAEDDNVTITFAADGTSTGSTGGMESNGALSSKLAQVLFGRRKNVATLADAGLEPPAIVFRKEEAINRARAARLASDEWLKSSAAKSAAVRSHDLRTFIPETGPYGVSANEVSPDDLLPVTNAIDLFAVDYVRGDGRRVGVVFAASTEGDEVYEHTKAVCDRLRGASLEAIEIHEIDGHEFVVAQLIQADNTVDYAASFVVYDHDGRFEVDSRFVLGDYDPPGTSAPTYNYQVWSDTRDDMTAIVAQMLQSLEAVAPVEYATDDLPVAVPDVYVRTGHYKEGELVLQVVNRAAATSLHIENGTMALTEGGQRSDFSIAKSLPPIGEDDPYESEVRLPLGPVFDADFAVSADSSSAPDLLYLADGAWGWAVDSAGTVNDFAVRPADISRFGDPGTYTVERGGSLSGEISRWATLFRYLRPNGKPVDLTEYTYLEFQASGSGTMRVQVEKESLIGSNQYGQSFELTEDPRIHRLWFDELTTDDGTREFQANDIVLLSFNAENYASRDGEPTPSRDFSMTIDAVRFRGAGNDVASVPPSGPMLHQIYPNPVASVAEIRYDLPESGFVRVGVFDVLGRKVATIAEGWHAAGPHTATFDASRLATGMYFTWMESEFGFKTTSMVVR